MSIKTSKYHWLLHFFIKFHLLNPISEPPSKENINKLISILMINAFMEWILELKGSVNNEYKKEKINITK
jgi:hypothetical protein